MFPLLRLGQAEEGLKLLENIKADIPSKVRSNQQRAKLTQLINQRLASDEFRFLGPGSGRTEVGRK